MRQPARCEVIVAQLEVNIAEHALAFHHQRLLVHVVCVCRHGAARQNAHQHRARTRVFAQHFDRHLARNRLPFAVLGTDRHVVKRIRRHRLHAAQDAFTQTQRQRSIRLDRREPFQQHFHAVRAQTVDTLFFITIHDEAFMAGSASS